MEDIFGESVINKPVKINIYADEVQCRACPYTGEEWHYIGIVVEDIENPLLNDIVNERFFHKEKDKTEKYYEKNNRVVHRSKLVDVDTKNIAERWLKYILNPQASGNKFYAYVLGINSSKINKNEFGGNDDIFNNIYNRFFRSAILYALKSFFSKRDIIVYNLYHEEGQQEYHQFFPRHTIQTIENSKENISFLCDTIKFLPKDHKLDEKSNLIQLCDVFLGICTSIVHGINASKRSIYKENLSELFLPLMERMAQKPWNSNGRYKHGNRMMIRFFPKQKTDRNAFERYVNHFYTERELYFKEQNIARKGIKQPSLF